MESYTRRIGRGLMISLFFTLALNAVNYLLNIVLARSLGAEKYGLFSAVLTFTLFFLFFRDLGLPQTLSRFIPQFLVEKEYAKIKSAIVSTLLFQAGSSLLFGVVVFFSAEYLAIHYFKDLAAAPLLQILILYTFFSLFYILAKNVMLGFQKIGHFAFIDFLKRTLILVLSLIFLQLNWGVYAPAIAYALVSPLLLFFYLPKTLKLMPFFHVKMAQFKETSKEISTFAFPMFISSVGSKMTGYVDTLILTYFRTLEEVGVYNVVFPSALIPMFFAGTIAGLSVPFIAEMWARKELGKLTEALRIIYRYAFVCIIPLIGALFVFAGPFFHFIYGDEYLIGVTAFRIILVGVLFVTVGGINQSILASLGKPQWVVRISLGAALLNVVLNLILIPLWGIEGAALSMAFSYIFMLISSVILIKKILQVNPPLQDWGKLSLVAMVYCFLLIFVARMLTTLPLLGEIFLSVLLAGILYLYLIYLLHLVDLKEIQYYLKVFLKKKKSEEIPE